MHWQYDKSPVEAASAVGGNHPRSRSSNPGSSSLEAASFGLPIVATDLLRGQLGWNDGIDLLSAGSADPGRFADLVVMLYRDPALWHRLRDNALQRLRDNALQRLRADLVPVPRQQKVLGRIQKHAAVGLSPRNTSGRAGRSCCTSLSARSPRGPPHELRHQRMRQEYIKALVGRHVVRRRQSDMIDMAEASRRGRLLQSEPEKPPPRRAAAPAADDALDTPADG